MKNLITIGLIVFTLLADYATEAANTDLAPAAPQGGGPE